MTARAVATKPDEHGDRTMTELIAEAVSILERMMVVLEAEHLDQR